MGRPSSTLPSSTSSSSPSLAPPGGGAPQEFSGEVFGYDTSTKSVILKEGPGPEYTLRVLNTAFVKELVQASRPSKPADLRLPPVDLERALEREAAAVKAARVAMMRIGVGVTAEGQEIFDSLSKTMPCVWEDKAIVILNEVVIESPYTPDHVSSRSGDQATLDRVKKVLEAERARIAAGEAKALVQ